ncbi:hypothetical protein DASB73_036300 [Starmerella bacillaris]|uniref:Uncharacterized protein n=1 Tax=Starmerella bacillaris TaxID=1247836 RepID=A0AAV5RN34_STABA|nr:hypothetical protein DASB73_036300 [Starmerella bacillaris]
MDKLRKSVHELSTEFEELLSKVSQSVSTVSDHYYEESVDRIHTSETGVLEESVKLRSQISDILADNKQLRLKLEQLQQILYITEDLKNEVRDLEERLR